MKDNLYKRIQQIEAVTAARKAEMIDTLKATYKKACEENNEEEAAFFARKIRDKLLDNSDKEMSLDRLGLDTSSATKFISSLTAIFKGKWAKYRQALRDLPEQKGFPFGIEFPSPPDNEAADEQ